VIEVTRLNAGNEVRLLGRDSRGGASPSSGAQRRASAFVEFAGVSIDEATRKTGGDLGYLTAAQLEEPVARAASARGRARFTGRPSSTAGNVGRGHVDRRTTAAKFADVKDAFRKQRQQEQKFGNVGLAGKGIREAAFITPTRTDPPIRSRRHR